MTSDDRAATARVQGFLGELAFGSYEDALGWIGTKSEVMYAPAEVSRGTIRLYASALEDANPNYWDEEYARQRWGAVIAPAAMLQWWLVPLDWQPDSPPNDTRLRWRIPLPGDATLDTEMEYEFFKPVKVGDRLSAQEEVISISPEKNTKVGPGHWVTILQTFRNQDDELVGSLKVTFLRYKTGHRQERPEYQANA